MLLDKRGLVKVGDFGQTLIKERGEKKELEYLGTPTYMAPGKIFFVKAPFTKIFFQNKIEMVYNFFRINHNSFSNYSNSY